MDFFERYDGELATTDAVLTEATHLLGRVRGGRVTCLDLVLTGGAMPVPTTTSLMARHAGLPMDYADATLVVLAEDLGSPAVFMTDRQDFSIYRFRSRHKFRLFL